MKNYDPSNTYPYPTMKIIPVSKTLFIVVYTGHAGYMGKVRYGEWYKLVKLKNRWEDGNSFSNVLDIFGETSILCNSDWVIICNEYKAKTRGSK